MSSSPRLIRTLQVAALLSCAALVSRGAAEGPPPQMSRPANSAQPVAVDDPSLKKTLEMRLGATVDGITRLPVGNLYEVRLGDDIIYTDPSGDYILVGNLIDLRSRENLTRQRVQDIRLAGMPAFKFSELPFDVAVKVVKGGGKRKVAIFEDPNCGYCRKLEKSILDIGDVTIYVFLYPVLGPDSLTKAKQVWCAKDRAKVWSAWMQESTELVGDGTCATPLDKTLALGQKLRIEGTPTLLFPSNKRVEGAVDATTLEKLLAG
jgi:thiol:disulfide interchange protein DsbC